MNHKDHGIGGHGPAVPTRCTDPADGFRLCARNEKAVAHPTDVDGLYRFAGAGGMGTGFCAHAVLPYRHGMPARGRANDFVIIDTQDKERKK